MKLNSTIYNKLLLQASEAKEQGAVKLANGILESLETSSQDTNVKYSYGELQDDIYNDLWKTAIKILAFYNIESVNAESLNKTIIACVNQISDEIENTLSVQDVVKGPFEPLLPGEEE